MRMRQLAYDPVDRFKDLLAATRPQPQLDPPAFHAVINDAIANDQSVEDAVTCHAATWSNLRLPDARSIVGPALAAHTDLSAKATAASQATTAAAGASLDVTMSDPVMLVPGVRALFALLSVVVLIVSTVLVYNLANRSGGSSTPTSAFAGLTVVAALSLVGALVLVMGYKNVTIKGGSGSS